MNKKAQAESVATIITLVTGVSAAVFVLIFVGALGGQSFQIQEDDINEINTSGFQVNQTIPAASHINDSAFTLTDRDVSSLYITLASNGSVITEANYNVNHDAGTMTLISNDYNNTAINVSYFYGLNSTAVMHSVKNSIVSSFQALEDTGSYLPIIVLALIIIIVLGLIITGLGGMAGMRGGGAGGAL